MLPGNKTALLLNLCALLQLAAAHTGLLACTHTHARPDYRHLDTHTQLALRITQVIVSLSHLPLWNGSVGAPTPPCCAALCLTVPAGPICCPAASQAHQHQCSSGGGVDCGCVDRRKTGRGLHAHTVGFTTTKHRPFSTFEKFSQPQQPSSLRRDIVFLL